MYVCMYVCMYVDMYVRMYVCMHEYMYVCMCVCVWTYFPFIVCYFCPIPTFYRPRNASYNFPIPTSYCSMFYMLNLSNYLLFFDVFHVLSSPCLFNHFPFIVCSKCPIFVHIFQLPNVLYVPFLCSHISLCYYNAPGNCCLISDI
jgi:hypothetical protein